VIAWTPPQPVSPPYSAVATMPALIERGDGTGVAAWWVGRSARTRVLPDGPIRRLPGFVGLAAYGQRHAAVATQAISGRDTRLAVRGLGLDVVRRDVTRPAFAGNARGDLALAWIEHRERLYVARRPKGGRFGAPHLIARGKLRNAAVAVGAGGRLLIAWETAGRVSYRFAGHTHRLRSKPAHTLQLRARVVAGKPVIAWQAQFVTSGGEVQTGYVEIAHRTRVRLLDTIPAGQPVGGLALTIDHVVWSTGTTVKADGRTLATADRIQVDGADGDVAVFTRDPYDDDGVVFAADLTDGTATQVSQAPTARDPAVADHEVVWLDRPQAHDVLERSLGS
jgi:hypothetical protein